MVISGLQYLHHKHSLPHITFFPSFFNLCVLMRRLMCIFQDFVWSNQLYCNTVRWPLFLWLATLHVARGLKLDYHYGPFQPRPFYDSVKYYLCFFQFISEHFACPNFFKKYYYFEHHLTNTTLNLTLFLKSSLL